MTSCNFYHDIVLLLTPITNITECYFLVVGNKIRTVDFDEVNISTAMPVTALALHQLVWALSFRYTSEQAVLHISTYISTFRTLYYRDVTNILVHSTIAIT